MRFLHIADLHFGKSLGGRSLIDTGDQPFWVERFLEKANELNPDAVVIAGDVYDRGNPSSEAVRLFSGFLTRLNEAGIRVLMVSGNHDSGDRLAFAESLLAREGVHIAGAVKRRLTCVTLDDEYGKVNFVLMPYCFPGIVGQVLDDDSINDYDTAVRRLIAEQDIDFGERNVLVAHQNVLANGTKPERGGSESMVGGVGEIDYTAFDGFDYVALGHIHAGQKMGRDGVRYAGSPLCYHFGELKHPDKGCILVTMGEKGSVTAEHVEIEPLHPMAELKGTCSEIMDGVAHVKENSYIRAVLTDMRWNMEISELFRAGAEKRGCEVLEYDSEYESVYMGTGHRSASELRAKSIDELFFEYCAEQFRTELDSTCMHMITDAAERAISGSTARKYSAPEDDTDAQEISDAAYGQGANE